MPPDAVPYGPDLDRVAVWSRAFQGKAAAQRCAAEDRGRYERAMAAGRIEAAAYWLNSLYVQNRLVAFYDALAKEFSHDGVPDGRLQPAGQPPQQRDAAVGGEDDGAGLS